MKVCSAGAMRRIDAQAVEKFNIPGIVLMENAAAACEKEAEGFYSFVILCGRGNNGGDGLALARRLINKGKSVKVYTVFGEEYEGDAYTNYSILKNMGVPLFDAQDSEALKTDILLSDCVIDGIFGTGFHGEMAPYVKSLIKTVNENAKYILSIDIPSGVNADTGEAETAVMADKTVTFAAFKRGLLLYPGAEYAGETVVADISIPKQAFLSENIETIDKAFAEGLIPKRFANSHKGDYGKIFIIGGSYGMSGAVVLAAEAAFRMGAGLVTACVPKELEEIVETASVQTMTFGADFQNEQDKILSKLKDFDVILFGNGIGRAPYVKELLEKVLSFAEVPVVIDADGLFALAQNPEIIKNSKAEIILTPHSAEMGRLIGIDAELVEKSRLEVSANFAAEYGLTLVLKGNHSIITVPEGSQYINLTGNSGMATAGSGDALAGMIAALSAVMTPPQAAVLGVYLHGLSGDYAKEKLSEMSVTAPDIIASIPHILPVENTLKI